MQDHRTTPIRCGLAPRPLNRPGGQARADAGLAAGADHNVLGADGRGPPLARPPPRGVKSTGLARNLGQL